MSRRKVEELNEEELKNLFSIHLVYYFFLLILLIMPIISCAYEQEDKRELVRSFNNWETIICKDRLVKKSTGWYVEENMFVKKDLFFYIDDCKLKEK